MAHSYAHLFNLPITMFRFFTVYGPWGRPDMALFKFVERILDNKTIPIFNNGNMSRDFTYIDDLIDALFLLMDKSPINIEPSNKKLAEIDSLSPVAPYRVINIGASKPQRLLDFVTEIERMLGVNAMRDMQPMQPGDVLATWADTKLLEELTGYYPKTEIRVGIQKFVDWYTQNYGSLTENS